MWADLVDAGEAKVYTETSFNCDVEKLQHAFNLWMLKIAMAVTSELGAEGAAAPPPEVCEGHRPPRHRKHETATLDIGALFQEFAVRNTERQNVFGK